MNTTTKNTPVSSSTDELAFAYGVRRALDEQITRLPASTVDRLSAARKMAIARKKPESLLVVAAERKLAGFGSSSGNPFNDSLNWMVRVGIIIPLMVLIIGAFSIYKYEEARRIDELADLDTAVLTDELPLNAYLDHGFDTYLNKHGE